MTVDRAKHCTLSMMWSIAILLAAALCVDSYAIHDVHERLAHGRQLKIFVPKSTETLEFIPADNPTETFLYWKRGRISTSKGRVSGTGSDRRWYIDKVTYEDQGTYVQKDFWNKEISTVKVAVTPRHNYVKCVAGESLSISLEGIHLSEAVLSFAGVAANVTLVRDGSPVSQDLPDYWDRVQTHSMSIEIKHVNYSDEGHYTLRDRRDRIVSVTRMDLTDYHDHAQGNSLLALLLLLGIPGGILCCCRKKIFNRKATTAATLQSSVETNHPLPGGSVGPCPPYSSPGQSAVYYHGPNSNMGPTVHPPPAPGQWNGPPGCNPAYPMLQNPSYPPAVPAFIPPAQPSQWSNSLQGQYPPGPIAPTGCGPAPVMYSSPPPATVTDTAKEEFKVENTASSPADPLLTAAPQSQGDNATSAAEHVPPSNTNVLSSSDGSYTFQINGEKTSTNFL